MTRQVLVLPLLLVFFACAKRAPETKLAAQAALERKRTALTAFNRAVDLLTARPPDYYHALESLRRAVEANPDFYEAQFNLGFLLARGNDPIGSETAYRNALRLRPQDRAATFNLSDLYRRTGRLEQGLRLLRDFCQHHPQDAEARNNLAVLLMQGGNLEQAMEEARRVLDADPKNALAYNNLAMVFSEQGEQALAEEIFRQGLLLHPDQPTLLNNQGLVLLRQQKIQQAIDTFERAFEKDATVVEAGLNAASAYADCGDWERAERAYSEVARRSPGALDALVGQAVALRAMGRADAAEKIYQQVLGLDRNHPQALFNLGLLYTQVRGKPQWACEAFARYLECGRTTPEGEKAARGMLENLRLSHPKECGKMGAS